MATLLTVWTSVRPPVAPVEAGSDGGGRGTECDERAKLPSMYTVTSDEPVVVLVTVILIVWIPDRSCPSGTRVVTKLIPLGDVVAIPMKLLESMPSIG